MHKTFMINGGAGRVITAIPALEKFARLNPDNDFRVIVHGWQDLYWSHPILQNRTVGIHQKNIWSDYVKDRDLTCPEPYYCHDYYNQRIHLTQAFDREINHTQDHEDLHAPRLYLSSYERMHIHRIINELREIHKKNRVVVFQPYGSGMQLHQGQPYDTSHRSMMPAHYMHVAQLLHDSDCLVIFMGNRELRHPADNVTPDLTRFNPDLRMFMAFIHACDYFIGCDSVGQHIARAFNKPGSIFMGSTFEQNVSYANHFRIFRKHAHAPVYSPIRVGGVDSDFQDRCNDGIMEFSESELARWCEIILNDIHAE
jgi:hypothetical protein